MIYIRVIFAWTLCWGFAQPLKLPDYIKPCHRYAPDVQECILNAAKSTIPHIINGDPKYRIPPVDPILIKELTVEQGTSSVGLTMSAHDAYMRGIKDVEIRSLREDFDNHSVRFEWFFPELRIDSIYNVTGKILLLPIEGYGNGTITLSKVRSTYVYNWEFKKKKDGKEYFYIKDAKLTFDPEKFSIKLENLFHGNKLLGDNMNRFMNENWKEILKDVGPAVADTLGEYIRQLLNNIYNLIPKENVFIYDPV